MKKNLLDLSEVLFNFEPYQFWGYTSVVGDAIFHEEYSSGSQYCKFENDLIEMFQNFGIDARLDNKIVFEFKSRHSDNRLYIGFKDWNFSVGLSRFGDSWIKPKGIVRKI